MNEPQKKQNLFWTFLKAYWWAILIILIAPVLLNFIILMPAFSPVVGGSLDWLSFHGSYTGSVIASLITLYVLYKQLQNNHEENEKTRRENQAVNEKNRQLQLNILRYEQEKQRLNEIRKACIDNIMSYNSNSLKEICNIIRFHPDTKSVLDKIKELYDRLDETDLTVDSLIHTDNQDDSFFKFNSIRKSYYSEFTQIIYDLQALSLFINVNPLKINELLDTAQDIPPYIKDSIRDKVSSPLFRPSDINRILADIAVWEITINSKTIYQNLRRDTQYYLHSAEIRINKIFNKIN